MPTGGRDRLRWMLAAAAALLAIIAAVVLVSSIGGDADGGPPTATVDLGEPGRPIPRDPIGLSIEWDAVASYAGTPRRRNEEFARLLRRLSAASGAPVHLRVGGNSSDQSWWNPGGERRPSTVLFDITPATLDSLAWIAERSGARVTLGVNLALNEPARAAAMGRAAQRRLPDGALAAVEIGNEPDLFATEREFDVGPLRLRRLRKRDTYTPEQYERELHRYLVVLSEGLAEPVPPLIVGGFAGSGFLPDLAGLLERERGRAGAVSTHLYALRTCEDTTPSPELIERLVDPATTTGLVDRARPVIDAATEQRLPVRVTELNSAVCGGVPGVSDTAAAALWLPNALFELVAAGAAGADVHGFPGAFYAPIDVPPHPDGSAVTKARPPYDGMLLFARAVPRGSRLAPVRLDGLPGGARAHATLGRDGRARVLITSFGDTAGTTVRVDAGSATGGCATVGRLSAPRLGARQTGITTGERICPEGDAYPVRLDRAGAVLLTFATRQ